MRDCTVQRGVLGMDLSDKTVDLCVLDTGGRVAHREKLPLTENALRRALTGSPMRVAMEAGTHSPWVSRLVESLGHETLVANPRELACIYKSTKKNDRNDAEKLARIARVDPQLLSPICHRGQGAQVDLAQIRSRDALVQHRSSLINHVRGTVKSFGHRLPKCSTPSFHKKAVTEIPAMLVPSLSPVLKVIEVLTQQIRELDRAIEQQCQESYPETTLLRQVMGVGPLTALAFILVLEDHRRFKKSRSVGSYVGLTPKLDDSGETRKQLRITKTGDKLLRRLLVGSAHYILGPFGPDTDLRRWGLELAARGGKNSKKRAATAVARRLAVLLHSLWRSGEVYEPLRQASRRKQKEPALETMASAT